MSSTDPGRRHERADAPATTADGANDATSTSPTPDDDQEDTMTSDDSRTWTDDPTGTAHGSSPGPHGASTEPSEAFRSDIAHEPATAPEAPAGPAVGTLVWGCVVLAVAALLGAWELAGLRLDLSLVVPVGMVVLGLLLVVGAVATAVRSNRG